jgi:transcriptional antiterminator NusG
VVKIQSGREDSIKAAIERKVKIEGLEEFFGQIAIPVEQFTEVKKVKEKKNGETTTKEKKVLKERKKFPGYLFAEVEFNDRILYLFRETSGVGDFVGATGPMKPPPPMSEREVQAMLTGVVDPALKNKGKPTKQVVKLDFEKGDKVKIRDGAFANMEGEVKSITEPKEAGDTPKVTVTVTIFGRPVEVELDYWHVDKA